MNERLQVFLVSASGAGWDVEGGEQTAASQRCSQNKGGKVSGNFYNLLFAK